MNNTTYAGDPVALTCWKDIAHYFGKGVRTVQRWERDFGLPVRRPKGASGNSVKSPVAASPRDLELWMKCRWSLRAGGKTNLTTFETDRISLETIEYQLQRSRELKKTMKIAREEHQQVMHQLSAVIATLAATCQRSTLAPTTSRSDLRPLVAPEVLQSHPPCDSDGRI